MSYLRSSLKRYGLRGFWKMGRDSAVLASGGSSFHQWGARTEKSFDNQTRVHIVFVFIEILDCSVQPALPGVPDVQELHGNYAPLIPLHLASSVKFLVIGCIWLFTKVALILVLWINSEMSPLVSNL
jgi:hypothetical protein